MKMNCLALSNSTNSTNSTKTKNKKSFNGYVKLHNKSYSRLIFIILSTWNHRHLFPNIRRWAEIHNVSLATSILVGGCPISRKENDILCVNAGDGYEELTQKMTKGLDFLSHLNDLNDSWTHVFKIDDTDIDGYARNGDFKSLEYDLGTTDYPYFGRRVYFFNNCHDKNSTCRYYHLRHVNHSSVWFNKKYEGRFVSTAAGGEGYILKRTLLTNLRLEQSSGPYEDLAIANFAKDNGFKPRPVTLFSCDFVKS